MPDQFEQDEALENIIREWTEKLVEIVKSKGHALSDEDIETLGNLEETFCDVAMHCDIKSDAIDDILDQTIANVPEPNMFFSFWQHWRGESADKETVGEIVLPEDEERSGSTQSSSSPSEEEIHAQLFAKLWKEDLEIADNLVPDSEKTDAPEVVNNASFETVKLLYSVMCVRLIDKASPVIKKCMGSWVPDFLSDSVKDKISRLGKKTVLAIPDLFMKKTSGKEILAQLASDTVLMLFEQADESEVDVSNLVDAASKNLSFKEVAAMNRIFTRISSEALDIVGDELKNDSECVKRYSDLILGLKEMAVASVDGETESVTD